MSTVQTSDAPSEAQLALHRSLELMFKRIRRGLEKCDWEEVEGPFRAFCGSHTDLIPQWWVDEYTFQAMRLWANTQLGQVLRHFANFVNRAAGTSLVDPVAEAEAVRLAMTAPSPPPARPATRPPSAMPPRPEVTQVEVTLRSADAGTAEAPGKLKKVEAKPERKPGKLKKLEAKLEKAPGKPKEAKVKPKKAAAKPEKAAVGSEKAAAKPKKAAAKPKKAAAKPKKAAAKSKKAPAKPKKAARARRRS